MTEYTENYNLGKQTNKKDKFDMSIISENWDILDDCMKNFDERISILESGNISVSEASLFVNAISGEVSDAGFIPPNQWNYWQETNDNAKTTATVTAKPTARCLLLACVMHRDSEISIDGEDWEKLVTSPTMINNEINQYVTVWGRYVEKGTYDVTVTQSSNARMSLKVVALYEAESVEIIENTLINAFPVTPAEKTNPLRRLYLLSSIFVSSSNKSITVDKGDLDLITAEEQRFSVFYDYETDKLAVPTFDVYLNGYDADTANLITIEIEEE